MLLLQALSEDNVAVSLTESSPPPAQLHLVVSCVCSLSQVSPAEHSAENGRSGVRVRVELERVGWE